LEYLSQLINIKLPTHISIIQHYDHFGTPSEEDVLELIVADILVGVLDLQEE